MPTPPPRRGLELPPRLLLDTLELDLPLFPPGWGTAKLLAKAAWETAILVISLSVYYLSFLISKCEQCRTVMHSIRVVDWRKARCNLLSWCWVMNSCVEAKSTERDQIVSAQSNDWTGYGNVNEMRGTRSKLDPKGKNNIPKRVTLKVVLEWMDEWIPFELISSRSSFRPSYLRLIIQIDVMRGNRASQDDPTTVSLSVCLSFARTYVSFLPSEQFSKDWFTARIFGLAKSLKKKEKRQWALSNNAFFAFWTDFAVELTRWSSLTRWWCIGMSPLLKIVSMSSADWLVDCWIDSFEWYGMGWDGITWECNEQLRQTIGLSDKSPKRCET